MVNLPLVVSNCALNVSGAFSVSLDGSAAADLVSSALAPNVAANRPSVQRNILIFMAGNVPCGPEKVTRELFFHGPADEAAALTATGTGDQPDRERNSPHQDTGRQCQESHPSLARPVHRHLTVFG